MKKYSYGRGSYPALALGRLCTKGFQSVSNTSAERFWRGVIELLDDYMGDTFRVVLFLSGSSKVHVLHAFKKKSKYGVRTPATDVALITARYKGVRSRTGKAED